MEAAAAAFASSILARTAWFRVLVPVWERYGFFGSVLFAFAVYLALPYTAVPLLVLVGAVGCWLAWQRRKGALAPSRWLTSRRTFAVTCLVVDLGGIVTYYGWSRLAAVLAATALEALVRRRTDTTPATGIWHDKHRLARAFVQAQILRMNGDELPLLHVSKPDTDEYGTTVAVDLPPGKSIGDVQGKHAALASAIKVPARRLHLDSDEDAAENLISMTVLHESSPTAPPAVVPDVCDYDQPLLVGKDRLGRLVHRRTWGCHAMYVGTTGAGKTTLGRWDVAHALADPRPRKYLLDFKDDKKDWRAMHPLCTRVVAGAGKAQAEQAYAVLQEIERVSDERRDDPDDVAGIVVVVDEWYRGIGAARRHDPQLAKNLDALFAELLATARSRRIKFLTFWQRGTDSYIDTDKRVNMVQRYVGLTENAAEARYVLDEVPAVLPTRTGEFLFKDEGQPTVMVTVPYLDRAGFEAVCARALAARGPVPVSLVKDAPPRRSPLEERIAQALVTGPMTSTALWQSIPVELRPSSQKKLAEVLRGMGCEQVTANLAPAGEAAQNRRVWRLHPAIAGLNSPIHAQQGPNTAELTDLVSL